MEMCLSREREMRVRFWNWGFEVVREALRSDTPFRKRAAWPPRQQPVHLAAGHMVWLCESARGFGHSLDTHIYSVPISPMQNQECYVALGG